jgi:sugar phosphate isomerase/epimerase
MIISRRTALTSLAGIAALGMADVQAADSETKQTKMGLCQYCAGYARQAARRADNGADLFEPERFFEFAKRLGAGGYQVALGVLPAERAGRLREQAESAGMYIEGIVRAPKQKSDLERFAAEMQSAAAAGAKMVRSTIFSGRRYEVFESLEQYRQHDAQAMRSLELAAPIAEKYQVAFAPENHKDHRIAERVAALEKIDSEFVGACVDTGNNFALLEDPVDTVKALARWAHGVHIKDQALQATPDGFLFADIPLGQGFIDLRQIVTILRRARPEINFTLELLTRDPLRVPCLEKKYWRTFADMPATDLARTLRTVRDNEHPKLQYPSRLSLPEQVALEQSNIEQSIRYAREQLGL